MFSLVLFFIALLVTSGQSSNVHRPTDTQLGRVDAYVGSKNSGGTPLHRRHHHHHGQRRRVGRDGHNKVLRSLGKIEGLDQDEFGQYSTNEQRRSDEHTEDDDDEDEMLRVYSNHAQPDTRRWEERVLRLHNEHRARFRAPDLSWSHQLYEGAREYAEQCRPYHRFVQQVYRRDIPIA